jgi:hypothetical protein
MRCSSHLRWLGVALAVASAACWTRDPDVLGGGGGGDGGTAADDAGGGTSSGDPALDDARRYNLERINALRDANGRAALHLDDRLNTFAQAGSVELSQDHRPHANFSTNYASCGCDVQAENQGDPSGWTVAPIHDQIDQILALMMSEGPGGGHYENILGAQSTRLGVGIVNPGAQLYFTNDFGP